MEQQIRFIKSKDDNLHYRNLRRIVNNAQSKFAKQRLINKKRLIILLLLSYLGVYMLSLLVFENAILFFALYSILGLLSVLIFVNIIHEAAHDNIYRSKWLNRMLLYVFDIIGGNSYIWKKRHILLHHNFQNISGWDSDIEQAGPINIYPHSKPSAIHKYQHYLIFFLYPLFLLNWIFLRDFKDFFLKDRIVKKVCSIPIIEYIKLFVFKAWFVFYSLIIPIYFGVTPIVAATALFMLLVTGGTFAMLILLTPHANEKNSFPLPNSKGEMQLSWLRHQFLTTNDITLNNRIIGGLMGNFNYHLAHHLFPRISAVYAPEVTALIKEYALSNGMDYNSFKIKEALYAHYKLIKSNAHVFDVFEEDM